MSEKTTAERFAALRDALLMNAEERVERFLEHRKLVEANRPGLLLTDDSLVAISAAVEAAAAAEQAIWICEQKPTFFESQKASLELNRTVLAAYRRAEAAEPPRAEDEP